jgi:peptide/nickel transport system substrate-binding protein
LGWFRESERFVVHEQAGPHLWFLILNTEVPPFNDRRVRQAVNYAVNKQALVDHVLQGTAAVAHGPIAAAFDWARDKTLKPYAYDPERARKLVREAGATGARVTLYAPESGSGMLAPVEMATAIQADLAAVGIQVRIETYEWNTFLGKVNAGLGSDVQMAEMAWMTNDPDTLLYLTLRTAAHAPDGFNSGYYSNPEVDELLELAQRTTERARRAELYRKLDRLIHEDAPWLFVASWKQNAVARRSVMNLRLQPSFFLQLYDVSKKNR